MDIVLWSTEADASSEFDLTQDSSVPMTVYKVSPSKLEWLICFNIHHIAIDEWGFSALCRELELIYDALQRENSALTFLESPPQLRKLTIHHKAREAEDQRMERLEWWLQILGEGRCKS